MFRKDLVNKNWLANSFRIVRKRNDLPENFVKQSLANITRVARITNLTKFQTQKEKRQKRAPKFPQKGQISSNKDFSCYLKTPRNKYLKNNKKNKFKKNSRLREKTSQEDPREGLKFRKNRKSNEEFLFDPKPPGNMHPF